MSSSTVQRFRAYRDFGASIKCMDSGLSVRRQFSVEEIISNIQDLVNEVERSSDSELPDSIKEFFDFLSDNLVSLSNGDKSKLSKMKDLLVELFEDIKEDMDESIWDLLDEGVEAESLEHIHSVLVDSIDIMINVFEKNSLEDLGEAENSEAFIEAYSAYTLSLDKLFLILDKGDMNKDEKEGLRDIQIGLEQSCMDYLETSEEFEPIEGSRV